MRRSTTEGNTARSERTRAGDLAVAMLLDKSGSMRFVRDAVIDGYNDYLDELRSADAEGRSRTWFSLTTFDTEFRQVWTAKPLEEVPRLDRAHYQPDGMTALFDAVANAVLLTERQLLQAGNEAVKVLVVVLTDGEENSSREYDAARLGALIAQYEARGTWTFVYLGAGHDSLADAQSEAMRVGIKRSNAMRWQPKDASLRATMSSLGRATAARKSAPAGRTNSFFADAGQNEADYSGDAEAVAKRPLAKKRLRDALPPVSAHEAR